MSSQTTKTKTKFPAGTLLVLETYSFLILAWENEPSNANLHALVLYDDGETRIRFGSTIKAISELPKTVVILPADHQMQS